MKRIVLIFAIALFTLTVFSNTIQELNKTPYKLLSYSLDLSEDRIKEELDQLIWQRIFLITRNDKRILALLGSDFTISLIDTENFSQIDDVESEKALMFYIQIQRSLFDDYNSVESFSYNKLLLDDLSYIDYFINSLSTEINRENQAFKLREKPENVTRFLEKYNYLLNSFYNNFDNYYEKKELDIQPTIYEALGGKIPSSGFDFLKSSIQLFHSQVEYFSLLHLYDNYQDKIISQLKGNFTNTPFKSFFKAGKQIKALNFLININFLEYTARSIYDELNKLNEQVSKTYGVMEIDSLKSLLLKDTIFEFVMIKVLENILENSTEQAKSRILKIFINREVEYDDMDETIKAFIDRLKRNTACSASLLSYNPNAYELVKELYKTQTQNIITIENSLPAQAYQSIDLIQPFEITERGAHFAVVHSKIFLSSGDREEFTKIYPVFSPTGTNDSPMILLDFFHTAANDLTLTLFKTLKTLILSGFNIKQLSAELSAQNVSIVVEEYIKLKPYHELYRMLPAYNKRLKLKIENANTGYLALDNLFAGNIPKVVMNEIEKLPSIIEFDLERYPIECYSADKSVISDIKRKEKAIIFVHGKQNIPYFNTDSSIIKQLDAVWRNQGRMDVWNEFYQYVNQNSDSFEDFDFYEFVYDTSVLEACDYGRVLSELLFDNSIHESYKQITVIASSMGGLVSRYCLNNEYKIPGKTEIVKFGDYIDQLITLDTPHLGTITQSFILSINPKLMSKTESIASDNPPDINLTLGKFIASFVNGTEAEKSAELMIYLARKHPEMIGKLFTEMLRFLDPFPGGMCMLYSPKDFCQSLGTYLYSETQDVELENIFVTDPPTNELNATDAYLNKLSLISGELTAESTAISQGLSITYNLVRIIGEKLSRQTMENLSRHGRNDGVVNLFSQQMWGIDLGQKRHNFMNLDHLAVPRNRDVIKYVMEEKIIEKKKD